MPFPSSSLGSVEECPYRKTLSKAERNALRSSVVASGKNSANPGVRDAARRLERNNEAIERAKLADHVYSADSTPPPEGWNKLSKEQLSELGLSERDLYDKETGLKAAIYKSNYTKPEKLVLAFAGTEDKTDALVDGQQGLGMETKQYRQAIRLSERLSGTVGPSNFEVTGHSLGGGLAAASNAVTGCKATTINAAGLSPATVERSNIDPDIWERNSQQVDAFNSTNDPLSILQDNNTLVKAGLAAGVALVNPIAGVATLVGLAGSSKLPKAVGNRYEVPPAPKNSLSWKDKLLSPKQSALTGHGSSTFVENMEAQKKEDLNTILNGQQSKIFLG